MTLSLPCPRLPLLADYKGSTRLVMNEFMQKKKILVPLKAFRFHTEAGELWDIATDSRILFDGKL